MEKWVVSAKKADFKGIAQRFGIDQVTARIIRNRDVEGDEAIRKFLHGTLTDLDDPHLLNGMEDAARLLLFKIRDGKKIRVIGDYDIDGVSATFILLKGLGAFGADIDHDIPDRMKDGYGLNVRLVEQADQDGVDTILTCDNGISAIEQIARAKELGMTVIVTDHHEPLFEEEPEGSKHYQLPPADILADPKLPGCQYPNKNLCGAAVAWKLVCTLADLVRAEKGEGDPSASPQIDSVPLRTYLLPFAAFATVGDVMDLTDENRIIVRFGLELLPQSPNVGMRALIDACGLSGRRITVYHVGFVLGPCINASGRLKTAKMALRLLLTEDQAEAAALAFRLKELNDSRKKMTADGTQEAVSMIESSSLKNDRVLVVALPDCHESIAGIVAGRLKELYYRPVFVLTKAQEEGFLKGSGRSIESYSMFEELVKCRKYLFKFGGHPMAAGLTLREEDLDGFRKALNENCTLTEDDLQRRVVIDVPMPIGYITEHLVEELSILEPCGRGNEKPLFAEADLNIISARLIGSERNMMKMKVESNAYGHCVMDALYFGDAAQMQKDLAEAFGEAEVRKMFLGETNAVRISAAYYPEVNEFRGRKSIEILIQNYRAHR